ncbi:MAG: hypothetical protein AAGI34_20205 [Pseudomonadota bacterium]
MPRGTGRDGAGTWVIFSQHRQDFFGRPDVKQTCLDQLQLGRDVFQDLGHVFAEQT